MEGKKESPLSFVVMLITLATGVIVLVNFLFFEQGDAGKGSFGEEMMDAVERLKEMVEDTGDLHSVYGEFEIRVVKPTLFPWHKLITELLEIGQEIWIAKKEDRICIISEPEAR